MANKRAAEFCGESERIALTNGLTRRQAVADLGVGLSTLSKWNQRSWHDEVSPVPENILVNGQITGTEQGGWTLVSLINRCSLRFTLSTE